MLDTRRQAQQKAQDFAQVPRVGKGGAYIRPSELNPSSRGANWINIQQAQEKANRSQQIGRRNENDKNFYMDHTDGHGPDAGHQLHHERGHFHAVNVKGEERIFPYGPPAQPYSKGGGTNKGGSGGAGPSGDTMNYFGHQLRSTGLKSSYGPKASGFSPTVAGDSKDIGGVALRTTGILKQLTLNPVESWLDHHILAFKIAVSDVSHFGNITGVGDGINSVYRIIEEVTYGVLVEDALPFVSLHFNNDGVMYPVMHPYYRQTLTGRIIGFLDYWMKCFVNGGFFNEDFLLSWDGTNDKDLLQSQVVDLKTLLEADINYESLRELLDPNGIESHSMKSSRYNQKTMTAFRIIGKLVSVGQVNAVLYPETDFDVEFDYELMPDYESEVQDYIRKHGVPPEDISKKLAIYKKMTEYIRNIMPRIPIFSQYFNLFKIVIFACYYSKTLQAEGKILDYTVMPQKLPFPKQLPPIPIRYYRAIDINLTVGDIAIFGAKK